MERVSENMHVVANEPSLALYRLQEHVRKALPFMVEKRGEFSQLHDQLQGRCYDVDYAIRYRTVTKSNGASIGVGLPLRLPRFPRNFTTRDEIAF